MNKMVIYQLIVRLFGNRIANPVLNGTITQNGVGKFGDITDKALQELKLLGATHIWYTGILEHATMSDFTAYGIQPDDWRLVKGRAGSPFAIKDYFDVSPELAVSVPNRLLEFEQLVLRTHQNGLKAIIDFIPNHVARGYHAESKEGLENFFGANDDTAIAFDPQNNFYYLRNETFSPPEEYHPLGMEDMPVYMRTHVESPARVTGNNIFSSSPGVNDWFETVKLNFGVNIFNGNKGYFDPVPRTWIYLREVLLFWVRKGVDGFRCDMAEMVPVEFWNWVIPQVRALNTEVVFIAEIYIPNEYGSYFENGRFDYIYNKAGLYDKLCAVLKGEAPAAEIADSIEDTKVFNDRMLCFLENHDETRVASNHFLRNAWAAVPAMTIASTVSNGPVMIYFGQEVGETADIRAGFGGGNGRTTIYDYWNVPELQKWMNDGAFDGGLLNTSQKNLRDFYQKLLNITNEYEALFEGDLLFANDDIEIVDDAPSSRFVLAYYRYTDNQRILIVTNFNRDNFYTIRFNVNSNKWLEMKGGRPAAFNITELITGKSMCVSSSEYEMLLQQPFEFVIPPSGAFIFNLTEKN